MRDHGDSDADGDYYYYYGDDDDDDDDEDNNHDDHDDHGDYGSSMDRTYICIYIYIQTEIHRIGISRIRNSSAIPARSNVRQGYTETVCCIYAYKLV